jgi:hypothetical protein
MGLSKVSAYILPANNWPSTGLQINEPRLAQSSLTGDGPLTDESGEKFEC